MGMRALREEELHGLLRTPHRWLEDRYYFLDSPPVLLWVGDKALLLYEGEEARQVARALSREGVREAEWRLSERLAEAVRRGDRKGAAPLFQAWRALRWGLVGALEELARSWDAYPPIPGMDEVDRALPGGEAEAPLEGERFYLRDPIYAVARLECEPSMASGVAEWAHSEEGAEYREAIRALLEAAGLEGMPIWPLLFPHMVGYASPSPF